LRKTVDALKYQAILDKEIKFGSQNNSDAPKKELTPEQKVNSILAEVIKERRVKAEEVRKRKDDNKENSNVFYI